MRPNRSAIDRFRLIRARTFWGRARGLLGQVPLGPRTGLLLAPCAAVHTFGMRYAIDVAFISEQGRVLRLHQGLKPWRVALCLGAVGVVEMRAGVVDTENGGVGRIEAAIQDAAGGDVKRYLQGSRKLGREPQGD